ncbi:unnamed protein product [Acanthoscelides obtectus]|uniref:Uncharacterized protein n=1 Tax=Acanthoscelides obtectus TaxID=200917 RepID=A0A9P0Q1X9_ACAOB|nr:unnamed protein product [Acanthoscelides obtectus]CAK1626016.1 hypothetical protein AOBTE_LOCUS3550 [Acanthoscelides obtectus]
MMEKLLVTLMTRRLFIQTKIGIL